MSSSPLLIHGVKNLFDARPIIAVRIYSLLTAIGLYLLFTTFSDYRLYSSEEPRTIDIREVALVPISNRSPLVHITGIEWLCSEELNTKSDMVIPIADRSGKSDNLLVYLPPENFSSCHNHQKDSVVTGVVAPIKPRYFKYLESKEFTPLDSYEESTVWTLCGGCNANDSILGMILSAGFLLIVVSALIFYAKKHYRAKKLAAYDAHAEEAVRKLMGL